MDEPSRRSSVRTLVLDEAPGDRAVVPALETAGEGTSVDVAADVDAARRALQTSSVDCLVAPFDLPDGTGIDLPDRLDGVDGSVSVVLVGVPDDAVDAAISAGVIDCLSRETVADRPRLAARRIRTAGLAARSERRRLGRQQYRRLFDQVPEPVAVIRDGTFVYANPQTASLLETDRETIIGRPVTDILPDEIQAETVERFRRLTSGEADRLPYVDREIIAFDGQRKQIHVTSGSVEYEDQQAILITARDVTERRKREARLDWYETMVETIGDVVYTLDEDYYFTAVAGAAEDLTGYTCEELEGDHVSQLMAEEEVERGLAQRQRLIAGEIETGSIEVEIDHKDGGVVPVEFRYRRLPTEDDGFRGTAGVIRDISERKEHERELRRQNERLEEFAGIVSHDLRNPLNVASGHLDLARDDCDSPHLDDVADAHQRMEALIENTLALARQGRAVVDPRPIDLAGCVTESWAHVATADATLDAPDAPDARSIQGDPARVQQLFENLFRNAIEHGGADVTVTVGLLDDGFYVEDDGPGIPESEREAVFEPGHTSATTGTGFGLAIVEEIVEAHEWDVEVVDATTDDGASTGTRFEVTGVDLER